ncbi:MAG: hypothetical protein ACFFD4_24220 [Candidatus Odinarchaeota archaeon]
MKIAGYSDSNITGGDGIQILFFNQETREYEFIYDIFFCDQGVCVLKSPFDGPIHLTFELCHSRYPSIYRKVVSDFVNGEKDLTNSCPVMWAVSVHWICSFYPDRFTATILSEDGITKKDEG